MYLPDLADPSQRRDCCAAIALVTFFILLFIGFCYGLVHDRELTIVITVAAAAVLFLASSAYLVYLAFEKLADLVLLKS